MSLLEELQEKRKEVLDDVLAQREEIAIAKEELAEAEDLLADIDRAIAALEPPAAETQESPAAEVEIPEGFTKWEGGECPVDPDSTFIEFYDRSGGSFIDRACNLEWRHLEDPVSRDVHIIAYRLIESPPSTDDEPDDASKFAADDTQAPAQEPPSTELRSDPPASEEVSRDHSDDASEFAEDDDGSGYAPVVDPEPSPLIDAQTCEPVNPHVEPDIPALIASAEAQLTDLRIRPLGIGYFSSSPDALDLSDDAKPPHQPARSQRVQKKREKARELLAPAPPAVMEMMGEIVSEPIPQPEWNEGYAPVTNPDAEAQAKALDYYSPERVAERNRFNPFNIFKREDA